MGFSDNNHKEEETSRRLFILIIQGLIRSYHEIKLV